MLTYKFICLGQVDYRIYLQSNQWRQIREEVKERDFYSCRTCNCVETGLLTESELDVHHRHYGTLGNERLEDLITLCRTCHRAIHSGLAHRDATIEELAKQDYVPDPVKKVYTDYAKRAALPDPGYIPDPPSQRTYSKPPRPLGQEAQRDFWKEKEDRGRLRRDV